MKALSPMNIQGGFRKTGNFPVNPDVITDSQLLPCESLRENNPIEKVKAVKASPEAAAKFLKEKEASLKTHKQKR